MTLALSDAARAGLLRYVLTPPSDDNVASVHVMDMGLTAADWTIVLSSRALYKRI